MTLGRLIMILIAAFIMLIPMQFQEKMRVWAAVLCTLIGCVIGSYPDIAKLLQEWKEGRLTKQNPVVKRIIGDAVWAVVLVIGVVIDWQCAPL